MAVRKNAASSYVTFARDGKTQIPEPLIRKAKLPSNGSIEWIDSDNGVVVRGAGEDAIARAKGMLKGSTVTVDSFLRLKAEDRKLER